MSQCLQPPEADMRPLLWRTAFKSVQYVSWKQICVNLYLDQKAPLKVIQSKPHAYCTSSSRSGFSCRSFSQLISLSLPRASLPLFLLLFYHYSFPDSLLAKAILCWQQCWFKWKVVLEVSTVPSKQHCCDFGGVPNSAQPQNFSLDEQSHDGFSDFLQRQLWSFNCSLPLTHCNVSEQAPKLPHATPQQTFGSYWLFLPTYSSFPCQVHLKKREESFLICLLCQPAR